MSHIESLNKSLEEWASIVRLSTHQELAKASFIAILCSSSEVDKFSNWLLIISGAAATLIISNLASITSIISTNVISSVLFFLSLSGIAGFSVKGLAFYINIFLKVTEEINNLFAKILANHEKQEEQMGEIGRAHV